ncbi:MAG: hypothetical protein Q4A35_00850 [Candidatus Gracilibacteria bacterium]|nr:hypothetical protein [Candidatus Gracilibacteria bacterium]
MTITKNPKNPPKSTKKIAAKKPGRKVGRPTKNRDEIFRKLEEAFLLDATIGEACFYAGISHETYYQILKENPEFSERFEACRNNPILKARQSVINNLNDPNIALKYLERKAKAEFSTRQELTDKNGHSAFAGFQLNIIKNDNT